MYKNDDELKKSTLLETLYEIYFLSAPYWRSRESMFAWVMMILVLGLNVTVIYLGVELNYWQRDFYNSLSEKDFDLFIVQIYKFLILVAIFIPTVAFTNYGTNYFIFRWRKWFTKHYLKRWTENRHFYKMMLKEDATDNPDQRISQDIKDFTDFTFGLAIAFISNVINLFTFVGILWVISGPLVIPLPWGGTFELYGYMAFGLLIYAIISTYIAHIIGKKLVPIRFNQEKYEANFRYRLVRFRERREEVAFYNDLDFERKGFFSAFNDIKHNYKSLLKRTLYLDFWQLFYVNSTTLVPVLLLVPNYFFGTMTLGVLMQIATAFGRVEDSVSYFVRSYDSLAKWRAVTKRLYNFEQEIINVNHNRYFDPENTQITFDQNSKAALEVEQLSLYTPKMRQVLDKLNIAFEKGQKILIKGPSGVGKSTLLRTLSGLWPFGNGEIKVPKDSKLFFIPQKAYMPIGTLREALVYGVGKNHFTDQELVSALNKVNLKHLQTQLDIEQEWVATLSLGEQQRIVFARILLAKPEWVILDEPTASLDPENEKAMYQILEENLPEATIITVGHSDSLIGLHDEVVNLSKWQV